MWGNGSDDARFGGGSESGGLGASPLSASSFPSPCSVFFASAVLGCSRPFFTSYRSTPYLAERESGPDSGTELRLRPCDISECGRSRSLLRPHGRGNATQTGDAARHPGKSYLFCLRDRDPGIPSWGERVTDTAVKGHPEERDVSVPSVVVSGWPLKIRWEGYAFGRSRSLVPISASGLLGEQPLVDGRM